jgi:hypothetical protein
MNKIVFTIEFPDGHEEYVLWEPEFYGEMIYKGMDITELFYNTHKNGFIDPPVSVLIELWENPSVKKITSKMGDNEVILDVIVGKKIFPIRSF